MVEKQPKKNARPHRAAARLTGFQGIGVPTPFPQQPETRPLIHALMAVDTLFARVYHQVDLLSHCPVPRTGPAIVVCNHIASLDPMLVQAACPQRLITWMMASEYMELTGFNWFFRTIGIIPVDRSGKDSGPLRAALRVLEHGRVLGIFPEGKFSPTKDLLPFQTGVGMIAAKTGATVVPVYQTGSHCGREMLPACLIPARAKILFGDPFVVPQEPGKRPDPVTSTRIVENAVSFLKKKVDRINSDGHI